VAAATTPTPPPVAVAAAPAATPTAPPVAAAAPPAANPPSLPSPRAFSASYLAEVTSESSKACFDGIKKVVAYRCGLIFSKNASVARKVFLAPSEPLSSEQRACVLKAMSGTDALKAPDKSTTVEYLFKMFPDGRATAKLVTLD
jgi:hypothetical protein